MTTVNIKFDHSQKLDYRCFMTKPVQQRTLKTRAKLLAAARDVIAEHGFGGLRADQVVKRAGVAKGTFFAHFADKDALLDEIIGGQMGDMFRDMRNREVPQSVEALVAELVPLLRFMSCERYVFDVILRKSGAAACDAIGPIAMSFGQQLEILSHWIERGPWRTDADSELLAEGIQAFLLQVLALHFCALHSGKPMEERLVEYLQVWLKPVT